MGEEATPPRARKGRRATAPRFSAAELEYQKLLEKLPAAAYMCDPGGLITPGAGETSIFITPGYKFRAVDRLLTNFHLPESTLLMLVSAFAGMQTIRDAYAEAIRSRYLFYSYGDCMFIKKRG